MWCKVIFYFWLYIYFTHTYEIDKEGIKEYVYIYVRIYTYVFAIQRVKTKGLFFYLRPYGDSTRSQSFISSVAGN